MKVFFLHAIGKVGAKERRRKQLPVLTTLATGKLYKVYLQLLHDYTEVRAFSAPRPMRSYKTGLSSPGVLFVLAVSFQAVSLDCCMRARGLPMDK